MYELIKNTLNLFCSEMYEAKLALYENVILMCKAFVNFTHLLQDYMALNWS